MRLFGLEFGSHNPDQSELKNKRVENAERAVEQAQEEYDKAPEGEMKNLWKNRLEQRQAELERAKSDANPAEPMDKAA